MRTVLLLLAAAFCVPAHANPALHGTWSTAVDGQPLVVVFEANKQGKVNDTPMQWQTLGHMLFVQTPGNQPVAYSFELKGGKLSVAGGDLAGVVTLSKGTAAAEAAAQAKAKASPPKAASAAVSSGGQELVGKWCKLSTLTTNTGGSSRSTCFELRADGSYTYQHEGSMSAQAPGAGRRAAASSPRSRAAGRSAPTGWRSATTRRTSATR